MKISTPHFIYRKMFRFYSLIIMGIVLILEMNFVFEIKRQIKDTNLYNQQLLCREVANELNTMREQANEITNQLYSSKNELTDLINYLKMDRNSYIRKRLDSFSKSDKKYYEGIDEFIKNSFGRNKQLKEISIVNLKHSKKTSYSDGGGKVSVSDDTSNLDFQESELIQVENQMLTFAKEIRDPNTWEHLGAVLITFNTADIAESFAYYDRGELAVIQDKGAVLYTSQPDININQFFHSDKVVQPSHLQTAVEKTYGFYIISFMEQKDAGSIPLVLWVTLITAGSILFAVGELLVNIHLRKLVKRLEIILSAMEQVKEGDLDVTIESHQNKDELDVIGENFNGMCKDLKQYIEKSYLAEIAQKNAEMNALQNQINPHFLYNTLESIRMKAITNGDREVGKMLYGLAVVFRSQIKDNNIITVAKELYYCKKYMELFEFRYQNKFKFEIDCPEEYLEKPLLKFSIQPMIENYFVHGIQIEKEDNRIKIEVKEDKKDMLILVDDNGKGMNREEIFLKNTELKEKKEFSDSIGIRNVHLRMTAVYGDKYGIELREKEENGLLVVLRFPG